jgi:hypothetical protein
MNKDNIALIETYYTEVGKKNIEGIEQYLHPDVQFISPFANVRGKEAVLETTKNFMAFFKTLTLRAKFGSADQAMVVYDVDFPDPIGIIPTASLMTFQEELVTKIELFFDARPFDKK